jgi:aryl-alcohol dehydrogenase-like predicted oxidoreductase
MNALGLAYDNGVNWFDVAPPYGDGRAEGLLGAFLKGRRDKVFICTKVGIPRPQQSLIKSIIRPSGRLFVKAFPNCRSRLRKVHANVERSPLSFHSIRSSVESSLRLLRTDYIDVLALHEPSVEECKNPQFIEILERIVKDGYARSISIAGSIESIDAGVTTSDVFRVAQLADGPLCRDLEKLRDRHLDRKWLSFVTHSVFNRRTLSAIYQKQKEAVWEMAGCPVTDLLLDYAFAANPAGVVLTSMYSREHILRNCNRASLDVNPRILSVLQQVI